MQVISLCEPVLAIVIGFLTSAKLQRLLKLLDHFDTQVARGIFVETVSHSMFRFSFDLTQD